MAVFGILILIVIYLLVNAKISDIEFIEALEEMRQEKALLDESVDVAEAERRALYESAVKTIENRETQELNKQVEANQAKIEAFDQQINSLRELVEVQTKALDETIYERFEKHPGVLSTRSKVLEKQEELETLKDAIIATDSEVEKTEQVIEKTKSFMEEIESQFRVEIDDSLAGESVYLVDYGGRQIRAFKIFDGEQSEVKSSTTAELLAVIRADSADKRVFIFVRPDGVNEFKQALLAFRKSDIAVGYQPVPAGEKLILARFPDGIPSVEAGPDSGEPGESEQTSSVEGGQSHSEGRNQGVQDGASGGINGDSIAQEASGASGSETATDGDQDSTTATEQPIAENTEKGESESASSEAEQASDAVGGEESEEGASEEASSDDSQRFFWLILLGLLLLLVIIIAIITNSKR